MLFPLKYLIQKIERYSLSSRFSEALRISLTIIIPVACFFSLGLASIALQFGVGSLLMSLMDYQGNWREKNKVFLLLIILFGYVSLITSLTIHRPVELGVVVFSCTLGCGLLGILGKRWSAAGSICNVLMIFVFALKPANPLSFTLIIMLGGAWSYLSSFVNYKLRQLKVLDLAISECLSEMGRFFGLREALYNPDIPLEEAYLMVIAGHELVNEKQEAMRLLILSNKQHKIRLDTKFAKRRAISINMIDLYEHFRVMPFDYCSLRKILPSDNLFWIRYYIKAVEYDLISIGKGLKKDKYDHTLNSLYSSNVHVRLKGLLRGKSGLDRELFSEILNNISLIASKLESICLQACVTNKEGDNVHEFFDFDQFLKPITFQFKDFLKHLNIKSPVFRYSLRISVMLSIAYMLTIQLSLGQYSYWVMLTIALVVRPDFSLTQQRNKARLIGTITGAIAGLLFVFLVSNFQIQIFILCICLVGFFCFLQISYATSVAFITLLLIVGLSLTGNGSGKLISERLYDTLIGCALSFTAGFVFPVWEVDNLKGHISELLGANIGYMENLLIILQTGIINTAEYKLSRKLVYNSSARLTAALQQMKKEPRNKSFVIEAADQLMVLNYLLYAAVSTLSAPLAEPLSAGIHNIEMIQNVKATLNAELSEFLNCNNFSYKQQRTVCKKNYHLNSQLPVKKLRADYIHNLALEIAFFLREIKIN
jgi:uncharacterized membrane protein YccC